MAQLKSAIDNQSFRIYWYQAQKAVLELRHFDSNFVGIQKLRRKKEKSQKILVLVLCIVYKLMPVNQTKGEKKEKEGGGREVNGK